jgi:AcrR family transcriptional regulator
LSALTAPEGDALMVEFGARLDPLFDRIREMEIVPRSRRRLVSAAEADLRVRMIVGTVTTLVVFDHWLVPSGMDRVVDRLVEVLARMTRPSERKRTPAGPVKADCRQAAANVRGVRAAISARPANAGRRRNSGETRQAIVAAAAELFLIKGYAATSYMEIALAAKTSKSALYRHFGSKSNLLIEAVLEPLSTAFSSIIEQWWEVPENSRASRQHEFVGDLYRLFVAHRLLIRILISAASDPEKPEIDRAVAAWFGTMVQESMRRRYGDADATGASSEADLRLRVVEALMLATTVLGDWFMPHGSRRVSEDRVLSTISELISLGRDGI